MTDSNTLDELEAKHERNREQRLEAVKHWVEYIESTPVEEWGPQFNRLVNSQLEAAQAAGLSAEHYEWIEDAGRHWSDRDDE